MSAYVHDLKTSYLVFTAIKERRKTFEFRKQDRDFQVGDYLMLREVWAITGVPTGDHCLVRVTYILNGDGPEDYGIPKGYCIMSIVLVDG